MPADVAPGVRSPLRRTADRQAREISRINGAARRDRRAPGGGGGGQRGAPPVRLGLLVASTILPLIVFAAGLIYIDHVHKREAAYDRVLENVRTIQLAVDAEIRAVASALEVLAGSTALQRADMDGFRANVEAFLRRYPPESAVSLAKRDDTQVFNSRAQAGDPLPQRCSLENIEAAFRTGQRPCLNVGIGSSRT